MSSYKDVLVIAEQSAGELHDLSLELLVEGRRVAEELNSELCAVVLGGDVVHLVQPLAENGADKIYAIEDPLLQSYSGEYYTDALSDLIREVAPKIVLCGATYTGSDLAPRIAAKLKIGLVTNCMNIKLTQNDLLLTKPTHGNRVHTTFSCSSSSQMATLNEGTSRFTSLDKAGKAVVINIASSLDPSKRKVKITDVIQADRETMNLDEADVIVAGGKGVGGADNFKLLDELAEALGGCVAGTRMAVDAGWISSGRLVGQTGSIIRPKLYIACGISGALHHTLGMKDSKKIVAINTDANAPIFRIADVGIVGNLLDILPKMVDQLKEYKTLA